MKKATSDDIIRIKKETIAKYPNRSVTNFGLIFVEDRWICGLIINGVRYAGEGDTPYDAHYALQVDLDEHFEREKRYTQSLENLDRVLKGEDDDSSSDRDSASSDPASS